MTEKCRTCGKETSSAYHHAIGIKVAASNTKKS